MENKCNSANGREREKLNIFLNKSASLKLNNEVLSQFNSASKKESHFSLIHNKHFSLVDSESDLSFDFTLDTDLSKHLNNFENLNLNKSHYSRFNFEEEASVIFRGVYNINSFLQNFNKSAFFRNFTTCQIIVHEKGQPQAFSITSHNSIIGDKKVISSLVFNSIFTKIKKSKNKQFSVNEISSDSLDIIGSFLAKEFDHNDFNFIIITSRGDLFSTSKHDKDFYTKFLISYQDILFRITSNTIREFQVDRALLVIKHFPIFLSISKGDISTTSQLTTNQEVNNLHIEDFVVQYSRQNFLTTAAELYHKERVILMGELLNTLKHELSNPLFGIQIASEILQLDSHKHDDDSLQLIDEIKKSANRCQNIIGSFSDLYTDISGSQKISLRSLIEETLTLTKSETKFLKKIIEFDNIKDIELNINSTFLSQIIFNLVINSSQALKEAQCNEPVVKISIRIDRGLLFIQFLDNGPGIDKSLFDKIFDPFYTSKENGTGLGLPICKKMASKLGGDIKLLPHSQMSTCFELSIPLIQGQSHVEYINH